MSGCHHKKSKKCSGCGIIEIYRTTPGERGAQGAQGPPGIGVQGPQGAQGVTGQDGAQGPTGLDGAQGEAGSQGVQGAQGEAGSQGAQGDAGAQGVQGAQGEAGSQGAQGAQGEAGAQGAQGEAGSQGAQGEAGPQGSQGPAGLDGAQGAQGSQGPAGLDGAQGAQGSQGPAGLDGAQGAQGSQGPAGLDGAQGAQGPQGPVITAELASYFGMTAGPSNTGPNDYPATIAISAVGPSVASGSAINFPRLAAPAGTPSIVINNPGVTQADNTEFVLPSAGVYRVSWHISVDEAAQLSLWISTDIASNVVVAGAPGVGLFSQFKTDATGNYSPTGTGVPSQIGRATGTSQLAGDVIFSNPVAGAAIQIRNYASAAALTVTPVPGGTQAQAVVLNIMRLA